MKCKVCKKEAAVSLKSHNAAFCEECFLHFFRRQVEKGIHSRKLFNQPDKILVALSGGKDSMSLLLELKELGYNASGLFLDLGIKDFSDSARIIVSSFCNKYGLALHIVDFKAEGLAIPDAKKILKRPVCSFCGQIKRYFYNRITLEKGYDVLATGHNLDDETARLFSNVLRWDKEYLKSQDPLMPAKRGFAKKVKPLWRVTEFETANYAFLRGIEHHSARCPYSTGASFSFLKSILGRLEHKMPGRKLDFYQNFLNHGKQMINNTDVEEDILNFCENCGQPVYNGTICGVCRIRKFIKDA